MNERGPAMQRAEIKASGDFHLMLAWSRATPSCSGSWRNGRPFSLVIALWPIGVSAAAQRHAPVSAQRATKRARTDAAPHRPYRGDHDLQVGTNEPQDALDLWRSPAS
jgi:hypothetical protein